MGKYKELAKNTVIISVGTMLSKIVSFLMTRFYTGVLTPAEYGTSDLLNSTVSLLMPVISLGIADGVSVSAGISAVKEERFQHRNIHGNGGNAIACGFSAYSAACGRI